MTLLSVRFDINKSQERPVTVAAAAPLTKCIMATLSFGVPKVRLDLNLQQGARRFYCFSRL
jgi:hypothetical protein